MICYRCHRELAPDEGKPIPVFFRTIAGLSLGPVHAGIWLTEDLQHLHCPSCRRWLSILCVVLAAIVLSAVAFGFHWAIKTKIFSYFLHPTHSWTR